MDITFKPVMRGNPSDVSVPSKYYAHAKATGCVDNDELMNIISKKMRFSRPDAAAAIIVIFDAITASLKEGKSAKIDNFGSFHVSLSSEVVTEGIY